MRVKCIGGDNDGEFFELADGQRETVAHRWRKPMSALAFTIGAPLAEKVRVTQTLYTLRQFNFAGAEPLHYLAPSDMTDRQLIEWQFDK